MKSTKKWLLAAVCLCFLGASLPSDRVAVAASRDLSAKKETILDTFFVLDGYLPNDALIEDWNTNDLEGAELRNEIIEAGLRGYMPDREETAFKLLFAFKQTDADKIVMPTKEDVEEALSWNWTHRYQLREQLIERTYVSDKRSNIITAFRLADGKPPAEDIIREYLGNKDIKGTVYEYLEDILLYRAKKLLYIGSADFSLKEQQNIVLQAFSEADNRKYTLQNKSNEVKDYTTLKPHESYLRWTTVFEVKTEIYWWQYQHPFDVPKFEDDDTPAASMEEVKALRDELANGLKVFGDKQPRELIATLETGNLFIDFADTDMREDRKETADRQLAATAYILREAIADLKNGDYRLTSEKTVAGGVKNGFWTNINGEKRFLSGILWSQYIENLSGNTTLTSHKKLGLSILSGSAMLDGEGKTAAGEYPDFIKAAKNNDMLADILLMYDNGDKEQAVSLSKALAEKLKNSPDKNRVLGINLANEPRLPSDKYYDFFKPLTDIFTKIGIKTHIKTDENLIMLKAEATGTPQEQRISLPDMIRSTTMSGTDTFVFPQKSADYLSPKWAGDYSFDWVRQSMLFDLYKSVRPEQMIIDSEWHAVNSVHLTSANISADYVRAALQLGALHGLGAVEAWGFERPSNTSWHKSGAGYENMLSGQPRAFNAFVTEAVRTDDNIEFISAFSNEPDDILIFYSESNLLNQKYLDNLNEEYQNAYFKDLHVGFITEQMLLSGEAEKAVKKAETVIIPDGVNPDTLKSAAYEKLKNLAGNKLNKRNVTARYSRSQPGTVEFRTAELNGNIVGYAVNLGTKVTEFSIKDSKGNPSAFQRYVNVNGAVTLKELSKISLARNEVVYFRISTK